jgi:homoserine O-acetyltransferase
MRKLQWQMHLAVCFVVTATTTAVAQAPAPHGQQHFADLGVCKLVNGQEIAGCRLGYRIWGKLNAEHSNAVLFPTWFSGTSANLADLFGPNGLADPSKYFVVAVDALGGGVSSSPSNSAMQHGPDFPAFTIQDMVNAEYRLATEILSLKHLHAVMGISMGGQQTFEWMVDYPDFIDLAIPIVGSPRPNSRDLLLYRTDAAAVKADPAWHDGQYTQPPSASLADMIWQLNLTTPVNYARTHTMQKFEHDESEVAAKGILPFDANDWLAQLDAIIHLDVAHGGSLEDAAKRVKARVLVVSAAQDQMVNPQPALDFAHLIGAKTIVLQGDCGHIATGCEAEILNPQVRAFLDSQ